MSRPRAATATRPPAMPPTRAPVLRAPAGLAASLAVTVEPLAEAVRIKERLREGESSRDAVATRTEVGSTLEVARVEEVLATCQLSECQVEAGQLTLEVVGVLEVEVMMDDVLNELDVVLSVSDVEAAELDGLLDGDELLERLVLVLLAVVLVVLGSEVVVGAGEEEATLDDTADEDAGNGELDRFRRGAW